MYFFQKIRFCFSKNGKKYKRNTTLPKKLKITSPLPIKTYWPAGGGRGQNPENTAQGNSGQNAIRP